MIYIICDFWNVLNFSRYFSITYFTLEATEKGLRHFSFSNVFRTFRNLVACLLFRKLLLWYSCSDSSKKEHAVIRRLIVWVLCLKENNSWHKKKNRESCKYFQFLFWGVCVCVEGGGRGREMMVAKLKQKSSRGKTSLGILS